MGSNAHGDWLWARRHHWLWRQWKVSNVFLRLDFGEDFFLLIRMMEKSDPFSLWLITRELFVGLWNLRFRSLLDEWKWRRNMNWKISLYLDGKSGVSSVFLSFRTSLQSSSTLLVKSQFALELDGKKFHFENIFSLFVYIYIWEKLKITNTESGERRGWRKWWNFSQFIKSWKVFSFLRWIVGIFHVNRFWQSKHFGRHFK